MNRGRGRGRNRGMLYLLAMQVASEFYQMDWKPPITAALIGANTLIYLRPGVLDDLLPSLSEVCLNPHLVIKAEKNNSRYSLEFFATVISLDEHWLKDCIVAVVVADNTIESGFWRVGFFREGFSHAYLVLLEIQELAISPIGHLNQFWPTNENTFRSLCTSGFATPRRNRDIKRLFFSAFYHVDDSHLAYNMLSLLWKGIQLERMMGSTNFASAVIMLLGMSHGIEVVLAKMLATFFDYPDYYLSECSVGFSAVLFALKVILSSESQGYTNVYGLVVPARHAAWTELILIQMFVPGVSFLGHLSGIIAGLLFLWARRFSSRSNPFTPMLRKFTWFLGLPRRIVQRYLNRYRRQTYGHGTLGGGVHAVWRCPACTFDNNVHFEVCEICGTRRGNTNVSPLAPPLSQTETRTSSRDLSLDELRRRRLDRFSR